MNDKIKSCEERFEQLFKTAFSICFEDNPERIGWEKHKIDCDVKITNKKFIKPDAYYLIEVYLSDEGTDNLFHIVEGIPMWLETYHSGRCSIDAMINEFTPENMERILKKGEEQIVQIEKEKNDFINAQK